MAIAEIRTFSSIYGKTFIAEGHGFQALIREMKNER